MMLSSSSDDVEECLFCCLLFLRSCLECLRATAAEDLFRILATIVFLFWKNVGEIDDDDVQDVTVVEVDADDKDIESISASQLLSLLQQLLPCFFWYETFLFDLGFLGDVLSASVLFEASSNASKAKSSRIFSVLGAMVVVVFVLVPAMPLSLSWLGP